MRSKEETLEEAKQRVLDSNLMTCNDADVFEMGVKWQADRMTSREESIKEAAERLWLDPTSQLTSKKSFIQGAEYQSKRMFSEEECYRTLHNLMTDIKLGGLIINDDIDLKKWFEKVKKINK